MTNDLKQHALLMDKEYQQLMINKHNIIAHAISEMVIDKEGNFVGIRYDKQAVKAIETIEELIELRKDQIRRANDENQMQNLQRNRKD